MAIDDMAIRDPRVAIMARLCGINRHEALGRLMEVWAVCYDRVTCILSELVIDTAAGLEGFAKHMVEAELAVLESGGRLRVKGAKQRISYLEAKAEAGRRGGLKSGESRRNSAKQTAKVCFKQTEAPLNPPDPVPVPVPDLVPVPDPEREPLSLSPPVDKRRPTRAAQLPTGWQPTRSIPNLEAEHTASKRGVDLPLELAKLRDWAASKGETGRDWDARWRNWLRNARPSVARNGMSALMRIANGED